jgi:UDP-GlcNAc:undecaprenyl-phosphate/decaprenyl-phosphate GlcNAc-1-phosphate transferase
MILRNEFAKPPALLGDRRGPVVGAAALLVAAAVALTAGAKAALFFLGAASAARVSVPVAARLALRWNAVVLPGGRYAHPRKTPLLGGLAIALPFVAFLAYEGSPRSLGLALGALVIAGVGAYDDLRGISPRGKLAAQAAAGLILFASGHRVPEISFPPFGAVSTTGIEVLLVVFWVVLVTNAINLIDGMDGLAATAALVAALAAAAAGLMPLTALVLAGAILGFLRFNLPPAQIFLGDSGSLLLGYATAGLLLGGPAPLNVPLVLAIVALPVGDAALSTLRRLLRGKPVFTGDRGHVHHRLLDAWKSPRRVLLFLALFAAAHAIAACLLGDLRAVAASALLWGGLGLYLLGRAKPRWSRILLDRKRFRRLHLSRSYATGALRLAEHAGDVAAVLDRVAADLGLVALRVGSLRVERPCPRGAIQVEEHIDCGDSVASWSAAFEPTDMVLAEEQRTILCDLLRLAHRRLVALEGTAYRMAEPLPPPPPLVRTGKPRIHFVADGRAGLARIAPLVRETRRRGLLEPIVVHTGRRDDLMLTEAQLRELAFEGPDIDLDIAPAETIVVTARVMERYHALLEAGRPAAVVVGDSEPSLACALVAKEMGLAVAQVAPDAASAPPGPLHRTLRDFLAPSGDRGRRHAGRGAQLLLADAFGRTREAPLDDLIPALEALLVEGPRA